MTPRVRWVTPVPPDHAGGGGHLREAHLLDAVAARAAVELIVAGEVRDPRVRAAVDRLVEVDVGPRAREGWSPGRRRAHDLGLALRGRSLEVDAQAPQAHALGAAVRGGPAADVVHVDYLGLAGLVEDRRDGERWVLTLHNLPSRMAAHRAGLVSGRRGWQARRDAGGAAALEAAAARAFDLVVTVSEEDRATLGGTGAVIPNGVAIDTYELHPIPDEPRLVFTGALYTQPNIDAVSWFVGEVLPLVRRAVPQVVLDIVGARPPAEIRALADDAGIELHPDVPDVRVHLQRARVAVVPIRVGSGTRLKALEAMAAGRPVVGTSIGLEGLGLVNGREVVIADDAPAFAAAVSSLLQDRILAERLGASGRRAAAAFDWSSIAEAFADLLLGQATER